MANWFVAFTIDPMIDSGEWFENLRSRLPADVRGFHPGDLHMTIAFLGNLKINEKPAPPSINPEEPEIAPGPDSTLDIIIKTMKNFTFEPITLVADRLIVLPGEKKFSAICLGFQDHNQNGVFENLERFKVKLFEAANLPPDTRPFLPHVTIARPPKKMSFGQQKKILQEIKQIRLTPVSLGLKTIALYTWADHRQSAPEASTGRQFKIVFQK